MLYGSKFTNGGDNSIYMPGEIAGVIARYTGGENHIEEIENCLYWLYAACQNEYNNDYFRAFYVAISEMIDELLNHSGIMYNYLFYGDNNKGV